MTIIVGGQARKVGKTRAVCDIIAATPEARWTAVKVTSHGHGADLAAPVIHEETRASGDCDTGRFLAAGAVRAFWIRARPEDLPTVLAPEGNTIIESNAAARVLPADLFVFVTDAAAEVKESAAVSAQAHVSVEGSIGDRVIEAIRRRLQPGGGARVPRGQRPSSR